MTSPLAGYDTIGMSRFNKEHFIIENGLVSLVKAAGSEGVNFTTGAGLLLTPGEPNILSVKFGSGKGYALEGNATFWGRKGTIDPTTKLFTVKGAMTDVDSINSFLYFNPNGTLDIAKDLTNVHIRFSGGNAINGLLNEAAEMGNLYFNYKDDTHYVKVDSNQNLLTTGNVVAYASGQWDLTAPVAGKNTLGMIKVGQGLTITDGVLSASSASGGTVGGISVEGSGNAITAVSLSTDKSLLTFTKGLTVWHAANDGAGSGLDADLLDGQQGAFYRRNLGDVNYVTFVVNGNADTYYPVIFSRGSFGSSFPWARYAVSREYRAPAPDSWNTATHRGGLTLCWESTTDSSWGGNNGYYYRVVQFLESYTSMVFDMAISTVGMIIWLRGGGARYFYNSPSGINGIVNVKLETFTDAAGTVFAPKTGTPTLGGVTSRFPIHYSRDLYGSLTGNATTATALQNVRTLWGQYFNGSQNVQGHISSTGHITPLSSDAYSLGNASNRYLQLHANSIELYSVAPYIDFHYGKSTDDYTTRIVEGASGRLQIIGKLAVGYIHDSYYLSVASFISNSWVRTNGTTGWFSQTYGGGVYMADSTYVRIYGGKRFYVGDTSGDSIRTSGAFNRVGYIGASWNNGYGALGVQIINNNSQTPLIVGYRSSVADSAANRVFALELHNSGAMLRMAFGGAHKFEFQREGNFLANGNVVAYSVGNWNLTSPLAGYNTIGMCMFDSAYFTITNGKVSFKGSTGGGSGSVAWSAVTGKPSWIGTTKPSYSWSEITGKPSVLSSISYNVSGSGNVVTNVTASGNTVYVTKGTISGAGLSTWAYLPSDGSVFTTSGNNVGVKLTGGNGVAGWNNTGGVMGVLYLNYKSGSQYVVIDTAGSGQYTGSWTKVSDMRKKRRLYDFNVDLSRIAACELFYYHYAADPDKKRQLGMSAQQLMGILPEFISTDSEGYFGIDYGQMGGVLSVYLVKKVYPWMKRVDQWNAQKDKKIQQLEEKVRELEDEINRLKAA